MRRTRGFTMIELMATLIVIGILAAFAVPRFTGRTAFESRGFFDQAQSVVRHGQKTAIAQRRSAPKTPIYIVVAENQISACFDAACVSPLTDPATGAALVLAAPGGVTLSPVTTFSFDGSGAPSIGAQIAINVSSSATGDVDRTFYVEARTGYVHH
jgi:MSHA pilin protein MshC